MLHELPIQPDPSQAPPVYDCHIIISGPNDQGTLHGVVSNLPQITATAKDERALLRKLVDQFKTVLIEYSKQNQEIPWVSKAKPEPGQQQRWVPVHL